MPRTLTCTHPEAQIRLRVVIPARLDELIAKNITGSIDFNKTVMHECLGFCCLLVPCTSIWPTDTIAVLVRVIKVIDGQLIGIIDGQSGVRGFAGA